MQNLTFFNGLHLYGMSSKCFGCQGFMFFIISYNLFHDDCKEDIMILPQLTASKKYRLKTRGDVSDAKCCLCGGILFATAMFSSQTDLHAPSLKRRSFSSSLGFSWKVGRWSASPGCPQTCGSYPFPLVQSSRGPGPSGRWSETISFLCSRDRKQCCSQLYFVSASALLCISVFLWELNTLTLQLELIVGFFFFIKNKLPQQDQLIKVWLFFPSSKHWRWKEEDQLVSLHQHCTTLWGNVAVHHIVTSSIHSMDWWQSLSQRKDTYFRQLSLVVQTETW